SEQTTLCELSQNKHHTATVARAIVKQHPMGRQRLELYRDPTGSWCLRRAGSVPERGRAGAIQGPDHWPRKDAQDCCGRGIWRPPRVLPPGWIPHGTRGEAV